jgi:hypothetical protein
LSTIAAAAIISAATAAAVIASFITTSALAIIAAALLLVVALLLRVALLLIAMPLLVAWWLLLLLRRRRALPTFAGVTGGGRGEFAVERRGRAVPTILRRFCRETFARWRVRLVWDRRRGSGITAVVATAASAATFAARCIACDFGAGVVDRGVDRVGGAGIVVAAIVRAVVVRSVVAGLVGWGTHGVRSCVASCAISASIASCGFAL